MCESTIMIDRDGSLEEIMNDVIKVIVQNDKIFCIDISGSEKEFSDMFISEIDSMKHTIILKAVD